MLGFDLAGPEESYTVWTLKPLPDRSHLTGELFGSWIMLWVIGLGAGPDEDDND